MNLTIRIKLLLFTLTLFCTYSLICQNPEACQIIKTKEINEMLKYTFKPDTSSSSEDFYELTGQTLCNWIAPPLKEVESGLIRNVAMITIKFMVFDSKLEAQNWMIYLADSNFGETVTWYEGLGDEAHETSELSVRVGKLVFSVRFSPYLRASRIPENLQIEGELAKLILARLN